MNSAIIFDFCFYLFNYILWKGKIILDIFQVSYDIAKPVSFTKHFNLFNREITQVKMKEEAEVPEHDSEKHVFVMVQKGSVQFTINGEAHTLSDEQILYIEPKERHAIKALTDVSFLVIKS